MERHAFVACSISITFQCQSDAAVKNGAGVTLNAHRTMASITAFNYRRSPPYGASRPVENGNSTLKSCAMASKQPAPNQRCVCRYTMYHG